MNELNKQIIDVLANSTEKLNHKQIAAKMKIFDKKGRAEVMKELEKLVNAKVVLKAGRGKYKLNSKFQDTKTTGKHYIVGRVEQKRSGMAFVIPQGKQDDTAEESTIDDIFVADGNLGNALNGDLVKVVLFPARKGKRLEGQVVEVVQRSKRQLVGTIHIKQGIAFFVPDNTILRRDVIIPGKQLRKAKTGDKVVVRILDWASGHRNPIGEVLNVLGKPGSNEVEMLSILAESDFPVTFPKAVEQEAEAIPTEIPEKEILRRRDFRDVTTFTIDPADAKDFDDALSFEVLESGLYRVGIHIA
ncbi:MAG: RNB domain-containing ribonuclease, partial [Bacteroidales bacterium]|nr:RNB domain-containing ribonuclease [Bacteroidales bacterium]